MDVLAEEATAGGAAVSYAVTTIGEMCCDECAAQSPERERMAGMPDWLLAVSPAAWLAGEIAATKADPVNLVLAEHRPQGWGDAMPPLLVGLGVAAVVVTAVMYRRATTTKKSSKRGRR